MVVAGFLWPLVVLYGFGWFLSVPYGSGRFSPDFWIDSYSSLLLPVLNVFCQYKLVVAAFVCCGWFYMALDGSVMCLFVPPCSGR